MTTRSAAQAAGHSQISASPANGAGRLGQGRIRNSGDEQIAAKLYSVGFKAALTVLLSVVGLGSAMAQSIDQDMTLAANTQANRDRVISEIRQARANGTIKHWSPVLLEVPSRAPRKGIRFAPVSTYQPEGDSAAVLRSESSVHLSDPTSVAPGAAE